jgi:hypothetical protein
MILLDWFVQRQAVLECGWVGTEEPFAYEGSDLLLAVLKSKMVKVISHVLFDAYVALSLIELWIVYQFSVKKDEVAHSFVGDVYKSNQRRFLLSRHVTGC